jgi:hypothetical protein
MGDCVNPSMAAARALAPPEDRRPSGLLFFRMDRPHALQKLRARARGHKDTADDTTTAHAHAHAHNAARAAGPLTSPRATSHTEPPQAPPPSPTLDAPAQTHNCGKSAGADMSFRHLGVSVVPHRAHARLPAARPPGECMGDDAMDRGESCCPMGDTTAESSGQCCCCAALGPGTS